MRINLVGGALAAALWCNGALADQTIKLDADNSLTIAIDDAGGTATVAVSQFGHMVQSVTIGNASVEPNDVVGRRFCKGCSVAYFVPAYDRTSNYGATTGIVAYKAGAWWALSILPLSIAGVGGPDASGLSYLTDTMPIDHRPHEKRFNFGSDGILRPR